MRKLCILTSLFVSLTAFAQLSGVGAMTARPAGGLFVYTNGPQSYVNLANYAQRAGTITRVSVGWSAACSNAIKIAILRHNFQSTTQFSVVAARGPFNTVAGRNDYTLSPAVDVAVGDLIAVIGLQAPATCGYPQAQSFPSSSNGFLVVTNNDISLTGGGATFTNYSSGDIIAAIAYDDSPQLVRIIPVAGAVQGATAFFRTSLQLTNGSPTAISGRLVFHPQGASASTSDPSFNYSLAPMQTLSYPDIIATMGVTGLGSLDIYSTVAVPPMATARIFSDNGSAGTNGFSVDAVDPHDALDMFSDAFMQIPSDVTNYRMNIGVRTLDAGATLTIVTYDANGSIKGSRTHVAYAPNYFSQVPATEFTGVASLPPGGMIGVRPEAYTDRAIVYSSIIDNRTSDPSIRVAGAR